MKVKLIQMTENPIDIMWTAARTCYASESPIDMWDKAYETYIDPDNVLTDACEKQEKAHWKLVQKVLNSGHQSIAEHVYFTFAIEGISRACSHQLVRHRAGIVFSQQSQRYVEIKENTEDLCHLLLELKRNPEDKQDKTVATFEKTEKLLEKYFVDVNPETMEAYLDDLISYKRYVEMGYKPEDARKFLPNATKTNITMSVNFRELIHLCNLRLCTRAQKEIRDLFKLIVKEVEARDAKLASYLVPTCEIHGFCFEDKCCGRKPKFEDVVQGYNMYKQSLKDTPYTTTLTSDDYKQLIESVENPEINEKLRKLMAFKGVL